MISALEQGFGNLSKQTPLLLLALLCLVAGLLSAIYVWRQMRTGTGQEESWPYQFARWWRANSLGLALIATMLFVFGALGIIVSSILLQPTNGQVAAGKEPSTAEPTITSTVTVTPTPAPYAIALVGNNNEPLPILTPVKPVLPEPIEQIATTPTPTPLNPYIIVDVQKVDYYATPNGIPIRFASSAITIPLTITGRLAVSDTGLAQWYQVCCINDKTGVTPWIEGRLVEVQNTLALKYVPIIATPSLTPTPSPTAPYVRLYAGDTPVNLFSGPGESFPNVAQLGPGVELEVNGKTTDGSWLRVCCIDTPSGANTLWLRNDPMQVVVSNREALNVLATPVLVLATPVPFTTHYGPTKLGIGNNFLTIYVQIAGDPPSYDKALPGYLLAVEFQPKGQIGFGKRESTNRSETGGLLTSVDKFMTDLGNVVYNYKFEYAPNGNFEDGDWQFWLTNASGERLSAIATFASSPAERGAYVIWRQVR